MFLLRCNGYKVCTNKTCRHIVPHNDTQTNQCDPGSCCYMWQEHEYCEEIWEGCPYNGLGCAFEDDCTKQNQEIINCGYYKYFVFIDKFTKELGE